VYLILAGNLREHGKMKELVKCIRKQGITVWGIQEYRLVHTLDMKEHLQTHKLHDHFLLTSSAWRNSQNVATGGVRMVLSKLARQTMINANHISNRIITASFIATQS
jgi:hypothetical protein